MGVTTVTDWHRPDLEMTDAQSEVHGLVYAALKRAYHWGAEANSRKIDDVVKLLERAERDIRFALKR